MRRAHAVQSSALARADRSRRVRQGDRSIPTGAVHGVPAGASVEDLDTSIRRSVQQGEALRQRVWHGRERARPAARRVGGRLPACEEPDLPSHGPLSEKMDGACRRHAAGTRSRLAGCAARFAAEWAPWPTRGGARPRVGLPSAPRHRLRVARSPAPHVPPLRPVSPLGDPPPAQGGESSGDHPVCVAGQGAKRWPTHASAVESARHRLHQPRWYPCP